MHEYIFTKKDDRDKKKLRETFGLKEKTDTDEMEAFEKLKAKTNNFNITEKNYLKESSVNAKDDVAFASGGQFQIIIQDEKGKTTTGVVTVKGASSKDGDNDNHLYKKLRDRSTTWNCSFKVSGTNNHNMSMNQTKVSTKLDKQ